MTEPGTLNGNAASDMAQRILDLYAPQPAILTVSPLVYRALHGDREAIVQLRKDQLRRRIERLRRMPKPKLP